MPKEEANEKSTVKGRVINQQPTVDADGTVYFATWGSYVEGVERAHGLLYAINPDGTQKWVYDQHLSNKTSEVCECVFRNGVDLEEVSLRHILVQT